MKRWSAISWLDEIKNRYIHGGDEAFDEQRKEALDMAISALREQEERSKGCEYCRESENIYYHAGEVNALDELLYITGDDLVVDIGCRFYLAASIKFCPMCGRRLEEV